MRVEGWLTAALLLCGCELAFNPGNIPFPDGGDPVDAGRDAGVDGGTDAGCKLQPGGPPPPRSLHVTRFGPQATVSFTKEPSASTYHVVASSTDQGATVDAVGGIPVVVDGLTVGKHYQFQVSSVDGQCHDGAAVTVTLGSSTFSLSDDAGLTVTPDGGPILPAQPGADGLSSGQLDSDTRPDLVATRAGATSLDRFQGDDGGFIALSPETITVGPPRGAMPVADFDGDGVQDVAMYEQATGVTPAKLLFASGVLNGSGGAQHSCQVNGIARGFAAADLLRAGHAQLVVLTRDAVDGGPTGAAYARLITFDGSGYTQTQQWFVDAGSDGVSAGDFDGDGNADLAFTSQQHADPVWLWFGDGTGSFPHQVMVDVTDLSFAVFPVYVSATAGRGIVVDGASSFHTLVPRDAGYVTAPTGFGFVPNSNGGHHMVSADLDGDGLTDLLSGDYGGPGATALKWWRAGPTGYVQSDFAGEATPGVAVVDIDNDNILDVVTLETRSSAGWAGLRVRKGHR